MKLCLISPTFPFPGESPSLGPDNIVYNLVKGIIELDNSVSIHVVTICNDVEREYIDEYFPNVWVHYLPNFKLLPRSFSDPFIIRNFLKKNNFDLVHAHYPIAISKVMDMSVPKILTLHAILQKEKNFVKNPLTRLVYHDYNSYMLKKILPRLNGFVANPYLIEELKEIGLHDKAKKVFLINNPVDKSFFVLTQNLNNNMIFYPARISERKNQLAAIHAIKLIRDKVENLKLILAGVNDEKYLKKVFNEIEKNSLADIVEYVGRMPRDRILELYSNASIVYLLSNQETQPMAILEAMATGNPVIASNIKSHSYIVKEGITGYIVNPNDSQKIAEHTIELLKNRDKRKKMGDAAKKIAETQYHPDIIISQTLKMYKEICNE